MNRLAQVTLVVSMAAGLAAGCNRSGSSPTFATPAPGVESTGLPVNEHECQQFAMELENAAKSGDVQRVNGLLRYEDLARRCISDLGLSAKFQQEFITGFRRAQNQSGATLGGQICESLRNGGSYHFLHGHAVAGQQRALFRMIASNAGVNYHDIVLARFPDGQIGVADIHSLATGEMISQTVRRLLIPAISLANSGLLARLTGKDKEYMANFERIKAITQAIRASRPADAQAAYRQLPRELQEDKAILIVYGHAAQAIGNEEYARTMETVRRLYPDDPCIDILSIDHHFLRKEYDESLKCIERVDRSVGGDPYQSVLRANINAAAGRLAEARAAAEKAVAGEPQLQEAYWARITISLKEKKHGDTLTWLKKIVETCGVDIEDLTKHAEYAGFVKTPQHREWLRWYAAKKSKR
jgi:tetratricopeptide (TPR) repeat protein